MSFSGFAPFSTDIPISARPMPFALQLLKGARMGEVLGGEKGEEVTEFRSKQERGPTRMEARMSIHARSEVATGRVPPARRHAAQRENAEATLHSYPEWPRTVAGQTKRKGLAWPVLLFLLALMVPWTFSVGLVSLTVPRIVLLAMVLPCLGQWITGRAGRIRAADIAMLLFCFWCALGLAVIHGAAFAVRPAGMLFVETMGAYFLSRCYIRSADDFFNMGRVLFRIVAFLFPFALFEAVTGRNVLINFSPPFAVLPRCRGQSSRRPLSRPGRF